MSENVDEKNIDKKNTKDKTKMYEIKVLPKKEVLDSQGRATQKVLEQGGFSLSRCSVGRYIEIECAESIEEIKKMANYVLFNPLIEDIEVQLKNK